MCWRVGTVELDAVDSIAKRCGLPGYEQRVGTVELDAVDSIAKRCGLPGVCWRVGTVELDAVDSIAKRCGLPGVCWRVGTVEPGAVDSIAKRCGLPGVCWRVGTVELDAVDSIAKRCGLPGELSPLAVPPSISKLSPVTQSTTASGVVRRPVGALRCRTAASVIGTVFAMIVGLVFVALSAEGREVTRASSNDGGAWLVNRELGVVVHRNRAVSELTAFLRVADSPQADVLQADGIVLLHDAGSNLLLQVDGTFLCRGFGTHRAP